jgi:hypothetical protein
MEPRNSPLKYSSADLEIEAIRRFRSLSPVIPKNCRLYRKIEGFSTILCLDFVDCPEELSLNTEELQELVLLLALSSHYLGLANSIWFKLGDRIVIQIDLSELE